MVEKDALDIFRFDFSSFKGKVFIFLISMVENNMTVRCETGVKCKHELSLMLLQYLPDFHLLLGPTILADVPTTRTERVKQSLQTQTLLPITHQSCTAFEHTSFLSNRADCYCGFKTKASPSLHSGGFKSFTQSRAVRWGHVVQVYYSTQTGEKHRQGGEGRSPPRLMTEAPQFHYSKDGSFGVCYHCLLLLVVFGKH